MAIVYSYPLATPESQDLLLGIEKNLTGGEDKPKTRTYTIGSIVDLVEANLLPPAVSYWTKTGDNIVNNNIGKVEIISQGNSDWDIGTSVFMHSANYNNNIYISSNNLELKGQSSTGDDFGNVYLGGGINDYSGFFLWSQGKSGVLVRSDTVGEYFQLNLVPNNSEATFTDTTTIPKGLQYGADYSANYTNRSLVDKGYVTSTARPYKVYTALLTQTGINPPVATILENTLGFTPTWLYGGVGIYSIYNVLFTNNKTTVNVFLNINGNTYSFPSTVDSQEITITSVFLAGYTPMNGLLNNTAIEVRVYN
jgi:hypothetical protein